MSVGVLNFRLATLCGLLGGTSTSASAGTGSRDAPPLSVAAPLPFGSPPALGMKRVAPWGAGKAGMAVMAGWLVLRPWASACAISLRSCEEPSTSTSMKRARTRSLDGGWLFLLATDQSPKDTGPGFSRAGRGPSPTDGQVP